MKIELNVVVILLILLCNILSIFGDPEVTLDTSTDSDSSNSHLKDLTKHHENKVINVKCISANTCGAGQYSSNSNGCAGCTNCPAGNTKNCIIT
jgi:hypothetical protein